MASSLTGLFKQLAWSDFGTPRAGAAPRAGQTATAAFTSSNANLAKFSVNPVPGTKPAKFVVDDSINVTVTFSPTKSFVMAWVFTRPQAFQDSLLSHEQGHYNITALLARDFFVEVMLIKSKQFGTAQDGVNAVNNLWSANVGKGPAIQKLYDAEANHGLNATKQADWDKFLEKAFNTARASGTTSPDGKPHKVRLVDVLISAGKKI